MARDLLLQQKQSHYAVYTFQWKLSLQTLSLSPSIDPLEFTASHQCLAGLFQIDASPSCTNYLQSPIAILPSLFDAGPCTGMNQ